MEARQVEATRRGGCHSDLGNCSDENVSSSSQWQKDQSESKKQKRHIYRGLSENKLSSWLLHMQRLNICTLSKETSPLAVLVNHTDGKIVGQAVKFKQLKQNENPHGVLSAFNVVEVSLKARANIEMLGAKPSFCAPTLWRKSCLIASGIQWYSTCTGRD